ncbi:hypothetical protein N7478_007832 [Penicillium angulare]|uniref:uncharacterized protein n=1 Tax=Penicillium angulare TaxID=116970 RepID=UPI0025409062|nr:uncharacterized protein N7478_007832 [Penicillium angulare]KAJ5272707.1 hypothetical protein N7478_007832 [Penicillium angulare]
MFSSSREGVFPVSWAWKRMVRFVVILLTVAVFATILWPSTVESDFHQLHSSSNITISTNVKCDPDLDILRKLDISKLAQYTRRDMVIDFAENSMAMTQDIDIPLLDVDLPPPSTDPAIAAAQDGCLIPFPIPATVPRPPKPADASHIDFGVATTVSRLNESLDQFAHWAGYSNTRIFALIEPDETVDGIQQVQVKAEALGVNLYITEADDDYLHRYFSLIPLLEEHKRDTTKWGCIIDDDTFFPSMPALVDALNGYDHTKSLYIGAVSEGIPQIAVFGMIAFGGAGVFLSRPLLTELTAVYDECEQMTFTGDRRIANCIYGYTNTRMTLDHRLHQLDLMKDASGFFEAGRELPLSVHHWKSWFQADMPKLSVISELCGPTCLLRRFRFNDGWMLTNGFSIVKYGYQIAPGDLTMEMTWEPHNGANTESYLHELGPLRLRDDEKISYLLEDAVLQPDGRVTQWYVRRDSKNGDEIIELSWRKRS